MAQGWREFYITQGVSALTTIWTLYDSAGEQLASTTTDNATQGYFPDLMFETSAYAAVTSTKVNSYPDEVQDALALDSNVPAASTTLPKMDSPNAAVIGTPGKYACSDHVHPTDTSRMAATATGADIPLAGGDETIYDVMLTKADDIVEVDGQTMPLSDGIVEVNTKIVQHADDTNIHVTATEKATWNGKQDALTAQQLANIAAVPDKLDKSGGTVVGTLGVTDPEDPELAVFEVIPGADGSAPTMRFSHAPGVVGLRWKIAQTIDGHENVVMEASNELGETRQINLPFTAGTLALAAPNSTTGNLAALDASGNPTDSTIPATNVAVKGEIPYILVTKTISNNAVTLDDRAMNAVAVSSSLASLTVNFPTATSGKVRDFGLRLSVASGITTAPELVLPQGITFENADGEVPEIGADGAATLLYFTETAAGVFLVKGEVVSAIS